MPAGSLTSVRTRISAVEAPVRPAVSALARSPEGSMGEALDTLGAALCRAGRSEKAIRRLNAGIRTHGGAGVPKELVFLAMAHRRLGHSGEARHWLRLLDLEQPEG